MSPSTFVATEIPPRVCSGIRISEPDKDGMSVVKSVGKNRYVRMGIHEAFLLSSLDGNATVTEISEQFERKFSEAITSDDVRDFVVLAKKEGLLERSERRVRKDAADERPPRDLKELLQRCIRQAKKQSPMFFRVKLIDPNDTLNWLEPKTRFLFSTTLLAIATLFGTFALGVVWVERGQLVQQFTNNFGWQALSVAWITAIFITILHEFGHGLACKRYGGDVHEMGALSIFFTPCFYCNVSDAWLLTSRWQRFMISMAGTYVDFLVWILAVFIWRISAVESTVNFAAWVIVSTCGLRVAFNLNPLMRLDGYYALCDALHTHNLRKRARAHFLGHVRSLLWGAEKPAPCREQNVLLTYGMANWIFTVGFLGALSFQASLYLRPMLGIGGIVAASLFFIALTKRYFTGSLGEDFNIMFRTRTRRVLIWMGVIAVVLAIPILDRAGGEFHVRPVIRREVRAPIAGFLREINADEGDNVAADSLLTRIEVPELISNIARKKAEIAESEALLRRLECGPRQEDMEDQKARIERASSWRDLAVHDLEKARESFQAEMVALELSVEKAIALAEFQETILGEMQSLHDRGGLAGQQLLSYKKKRQDALLEASQSKANARARSAEGVIRFESELAKREKELADSQATLTLLEAGSRREDIDAEQAHLRRLEEELNHFLRQQEKQIVLCPVSGTIITPRFKEMIGSFVERGTPLCVIEDLGTLEAEISVSEKDARVLVRGQPITLKPRSLSMTTLTATVDRIAPAANPVANPADIGVSRSFTVYCNVDNSAGHLRTGMTGYARIHSKRRPLVMLIAQAGLRLIRTEFAW